MLACVIMCRDKNDLRKQLIYIMTLLLPFCFSLLFLLKCKIFLHCSGTCTHTVTVCNRPMREALKRTPCCLANGNSITLLPSVYDRLTFVDSHPETRQQSQAVNEAASSLQILYLPVSILAKKKTKKTASWRRRSEFSGWPSLTLNRNVCF